MKTCVFEEYFRTTLGFNRFSRPKTGHIFFKYNYYYTEQKKKRNTKFGIRPRGYKTFFTLNSTEHETFPAHKC